MGLTDDGVADSLHDLYTRRLAGIAEALAVRGVQADPTEVAQRLVGVLQGLLLQTIAMGGDVSEQVFVGAALAAVGLSEQS